MPIFPHHLGFCLFPERTFLPPWDDANTNYFPYVPKTLQSFRIYTITLFKTKRCKKYRGFYVSAQPLDRRGCDMHGKSKWDTSPTWLSILNGLRALYCFQYRKKRFCTKENNNLFPILEAILRSESISKSRVHFINILFNIIIADWSVWGKLHVLYKSFLCYIGIIVCRARQNGVCIECWRLECLRNYSFL